MVSPLKAVVPKESNLTLLIVKVLLIKVPFEIRLVISSDTHIQCTFILVFKGLRE